MTFAQDLDKAKAERVPEMALRPDHQFPDELDDVVVKDVTMFRAEAMSDDNFWMCCYFANGERITWSVGIEKKPRRISMVTVEKPPQWVDIDSKERHGGA